MFTGFSTAVEVATSALDTNLLAASHDRVMVLEVIALVILLNPGIAGGADVILLPEIPFSFESFQELELLFKKGGTLLGCCGGTAHPRDQDPLMVKYQDGPSVTVDYITTLNETIPVETMTPGHIQRGVSPLPKIASWLQLLGACGESDFSREIWSDGCLAKSFCDGYSIQDAIGTYQRVDVMAVWFRCAWLESHCGW